MWFTQHLGDLPLNSITPNCISDLVRKLQQSNVTPATINRYLAVLRIILRKAANEWMNEKNNDYWLDKVPKIKQLEEPKRRIRFLTQAEAKRLISASPSHLADLISFSLATGLRQANVLYLEWSQIDMDAKHAWIHPDQAKAKKPIAVPLNNIALSIITKYQGKHPTRVFTYKGNPINTIENRTWKKCLARAGIENFKWHDIRHTWASWHVQAGTSLQTLMELGGWASIDMVLKYAHLSSKHLHDVARKIEFEI